MGNRRGVTLIEVIVVVMVIAMAILVLSCHDAPGSRAGPMLGCQKNLGQIGVALAILRSEPHQLPAVGDAAWRRWTRRTAVAGPLRTLLGDARNSPT